MSPSPQALERYADWTVSVWSSKNPAGPLQPRCLTIMSLGLCGECGEVMELLDTPGIDPDMALLPKEMGDVIYYWARICKAFDFSPSELWPQSPIPRATDPSLFRVVLRLTASCGKVAEALKKHVRDDSLDRDKLEQGLRGVAENWLLLCRMYGLDVPAILEANRLKVEDRRSRGVLRGNGDNR